MRQLELIPMASTETWTVRIERAPADPLTDQLEIGGELDFDDRWCRPLGRRPCVVVSDSRLD